MDEIELSIHDAWNQIKPKLLANPDKLHRRLARRGALSHPPRAWCLALRASDTRLGRYGCDMPDLKSPNQILLDALSLKRLCLPVMLAPPGEPLADVAAKLGVSPGGLLNARVKGLFHTHYLPILDGHTGKPHPMLYTAQPLDPASRGFVCPDPIWSWTGTYLPCRLPNDLPEACFAAAGSSGRTGSPSLALLPRPSYRSKNHFHAAPESRSIRPPSAN